LAAPFGQKYLFENKPLGTALGQGPTALRIFLLNDLPTMSNVEGGGSGVAPKILLRHSSDSAARPGPNENMHDTSESRVEGAFNCGHLAANRPAKKAFPASKVLV
jgi:hypothetical protein